MATPEEGSHDGERSTIGNSEILIARLAIGPDSKPFRTWVNASIPLSRELSEAAIAQNAEQETVDRFASALIDAIQQKFQGLWRAEARFAIGDSSATRTAKSAVPENLLTPLYVRGIRDALNGSGVKSLAPTISRICTTLMAETTPTLTSGNTRSTSDGLSL